MKKNNGVDGSPLEIPEGTSFFTIYCRFLEKITDDTYLELTLEETLSIIESIFLDSIPMFTYPKFRINYYDRNAEVLERIDEEEEILTKGRFFDTLTNEEETILSEIMLLNWYQRQLTNTRITQMRYSTSDFKQTSQAAHMQRLNSLMDSQRKRVKTMLINYSKRKVDENGYVKPNADGLSGVGTNGLRGMGILTQLGVVRRNGQ